MSGGRQHFRSLEWSCRRCRSRIWSSYK